MGKTDRISGLFWFGFSLFGSYHAYKLGLGSLHEPGPGFLFFWTGIVIGLLSLTIILKSFRKGSDSNVKEAMFGKGNVTKVPFVLISLFLYCLLMERLGFLVATLLLFIFLLGVIEKKKWPFTIAVSFLVVLTSFLLFEVALQSQLPYGFLEFLRF